MKSTIAILFVTLMVLAILPMDAQEKNMKKQAIELGQVNWLRDYDVALEQSKEQGKPVLILFQEVPGCATCQRFGNKVLSNGLLVDAIENEFIPLAIHNNKGGADKKVLDKYGEPTWNNPVVRIVDENGVNIVARLSGDYTENGLANTMADALFKSGKEIPVYLNLLLEELSLSQKSESFYKMYCFWSGEAHLGSKEGVIKTEPGFMDGHEVVKVTYDDAVVSEKDLDQYAQKADNTPVEKSSFRVDKDEQYYLKKSPYRFLPLADIQRTKINSALAKGEEAQVYLSPNQQKWLKLIAQKNQKDLPIVYTEDWLVSWWNMSSILE